jgi:ketosteroid isomerase-like protein
VSQEKGEIVRRLYDAVARRDSEAVLSIYDPDLVWDHSHNRETDRLMGGPTVYHGHEGLRRWSRSFYDAWASVDAELEAVIDAGDSLVVILNYRGRGRASGAEVQFTGLVGVFTIERGKVVRAVWFRDRSEALEFAGVRELDA